MTHEHILKLIAATAHKLHVPSHLRDEAKSEGLVIAAGALKTFDASHGVPLAAHVALRLRWGLIDWWNKEKLDLHGPLVLDLVDQFGDEITEPIDPASERDIDHDTDCAVLLATVLELCDTILTTKERICLLGTAIGLYPAEVSRLARVNGKGMKEAVASAREKLKIALKIGGENPLLLLMDKV